MGVNLRDLILKQEVDFDYFAGRTLAIDASNILYQFLATIRGRDGMPLVDSQGRVTSHLNGLFYRTAKMLENEIIPVYIFDGQPPELKGATLEARTTVRTEAAKKWAKALEAGEEEEARKYAQASIKLTKPMAEDAKKLLEAMGVSWVQAPSEGEAQASYMALHGQVYGVVSQDYDSLLFGAPFLARNLTVSGRRKIPAKNIYIDVKPEVISLEDSLKALGITRQQLIWLAMLVGTDYDEGVMGYGPKKALKLVQESSSLKEVLKKSGEIPNAQQIESIFLDPAVEKNPKIQNFKPIKEKLLRFLVDEHNFTPERVTPTIDKICKTADEKTSQMRLGEWG